MLCQCGRGIVACGGVCMSCWDDIQPKLPVRWSKLNVQSTERLEGSKIWLDEVATTAGDMNVLTLEKLLDAYNKLPPKREIIRSRQCVDAQGNPAVYEFNQEVESPGYFSPSGAYVPGACGRKVTIVAHPDTGL